MRSAVDLLDLPYSFTQLEPLMPGEFQAEAKQRGLMLTDTELETLHRLRFVVPTFRVARDGRELALLARRQPDRIYKLCGWKPTSRQHLEQARRAGMLFEADAERFRSLTSRRRTFAGLVCEQSV